MGTLSLCWPSPTAPHTVQWPHCAGTPWDGCVQGWGDIYMAQHPDSPQGSVPVSPPVWVASPSAWALLSPSRVPRRGSQTALF